jgi:hypothetical protein
MRSALCCLSPRASDEFFLIVPRLPSWPQGRWGTPLSLLLFVRTSFLLPFEHYSHMLRGAQNRACQSPGTRLKPLKRPVNQDAVSQQKCSGYELADGNWGEEESDFLPGRCHL